MSCNHQPRYANIQCFFRGRAEGVQAFQNMFPLINIASDEFATYTSGYPYLHWACRKNHYKVARGLVQCGASLLQQDSRGWTPLHHACYGVEDRVKLVTWILSHPDGIASIHIQSNEPFGGTPIKWILCFDNGELARLLLAHGARLDQLYTKNVARNGNIAALLQKPHDCAAIDEWRPWRAKAFPRMFRSSLRTLLLLAKIKPMEKKVVHTEWRSWFATMYPMCCRSTIRTLLILARSTCIKSKKLIEPRCKKKQKYVYTFKEAYVCLLPNELLQYVFLYCSLGYKRK